MLREDLLLAAEERIDAAARAKRERDDALSAIKERAVAHRKAATQTRIDAEKESERQRDCELAAAKEQRDAEIAQAATVSPASVVTTNYNPGHEIPVLSAESISEFNLFGETDAQPFVVESSPPLPPSKSRGSLDMEDYVPHPLEPRQGGPLPPFALDFFGPRLSEPSLETRWLLSRWVAVSILFLLVFVHVGACFALVTG